MHIYICIYIHTCYIYIYIYIYMYIYIHTTAVLTILAILMLEDCLSIRPCTINSDDPLLFGCCLLGEYERCRQELLGLKSTA